MSFLVQSLIRDMYFSWPLGCCILSFIASVDLVERFWSPKTYERDMLIHMSLWSEDMTWLKGRYPPSVMLIPVVPHIPSMGCLFLLLLVVAGPFLPCILSMSFLVPREESKSEIFFWGCVCLGIP